MKHARAWTFGLAMLGLTGLAAQAASEMVLDQVLQEGSTKYLDHPAGILLREGFWAKAGADVTMRIDQTPGYSIDKTPLDPKDPQYTVNDSRMFVVAGCVPKNLPHPGLVGSVWVACNDLDFAKDKVVESAFISCLDLFRNGVVSGASVKEINNRTWESFRFSCSDLAPGGRAGRAGAEGRLLVQLRARGQAVRGERARRLRHVWHQGILELAARQRGPGELRSHARIRCADLRGQDEGS